MKKNFLLFSLFFLIGSFSANPLWGYCNEGHYFGITSGEPLFSTIDVSFSTFYSTTSTSGTSGCSNWDLAHYLEESRKQFVAQKSSQILEEAAQGSGPHLEALGRLMGCDTQQLEHFNQLLQSNLDAWSPHLGSATSKASAIPFINDLKHHIQIHPQLKDTCSLVG